MGRDWKDKEDIAEKIRNVVSDALDSKEFGQLNQSISDTVGAALNEVRTHIGNYREKNAGRKLPAKPKPLEIRVNWRGRVSGIVFTILGAIGTGLFGILLTGGIAIASYFQAVSGWLVTGLLAAITLGFLALLVTGIRSNGRISRLKGYVKELKDYGKPYCELDFLSQRCGKSLDYIRKDLRKILDLGMLPDARLDDQKTCLILNQETWQQYRNTQNLLIERQREERRKQEESKRQEDFRRQEEYRQQEERRKQEEEKRQEERRRQKEHKQQETVWSQSDTAGTGSAGNPALETAIRHGEQYMDTLDRMRDSLQDQPIVEKLLRLDTVLERLFATLRKYPDQLDEMERFMEYYLPTTVKLVTAYQEFTQVEFPGDNIKTAKKEIEQTLDTINSAFEKLLDDLYQDAAFDVLSDASVLQTILTQEGLTESDFK